MHGTQGFFAESEEMDAENITMEYSDNPDFVTGNKLYRSAALFLLSVKERFQLTQSALDFIIQQVKQMISFAVDDAEEKVKVYLTEQGVTELPDISKCFEGMNNPFIYLETEYMQNKFYQENFNLVVSFYVYKWYNYM